MPPHCDTRDGPVVKAAKKSLETGNINYVLIWIPEDSEKELNDVFARTLRARKAGKDAQDVADDWFFETAIRLHRAGEGAPYTGIKPAGLDEGPVVPKAEQAIETEDPTEVIQFICHTIEDDLRHRFDKAIQTRKYNPNNVKAGRAYVQAYLNFVVYAHHLYLNVKGHGGHESQVGHRH